MSASRYAAFTLQRSQDFVYGVFVGFDKGSEGTADGETPEFNEGFEFGLKARATFLQEKGPQS